MKRLVFFILSSLVVFVITLYFRLGGHKSVTIEIQTLPQMHLVFAKHQGPYHEINQAISQVEKWAQQLNIPCRKTFGEYFDDPRQVDERHLQSIGGCVLTMPAPEISDKNIEYKNISEKKWLTAVFEGAPSIGPLKVYPKVEEYLSKNKLIKNGSVIEIYEIFSDKEARTQYLFHVNISE